MSLNPVVPDPLPASAIIDMSGPTNIATNDLLAAPQSLVPINGALLES